ncbi:PREDICTED: putative all-trans-retinol 13,14-reductase [Priapulus caudatus]|uniref:All-trans-retinol 13,14-reductase n=1 Tax=Priapulus caudatus TaxID=37621 RepID=A0ABM1EN76_PRICU|nr:PREDICTED: putative all-trans-retinol 13,14-reductase [Priapulus caudatus]
MRSPVKEVLVRRGKAVGVKVQKSSGDINIFAPLIISDAGVFNTLQNLLPREIAAKSYMHPLIEKGKIKHGHGAMSLFVGLKGGTKELGLSKVNIWAYLASLIRTFMFLGFTPAPPGSEPVGARKIGDENFLMVYTVE